MKKSGMSHVEPMLSMQRLRQFGGIGESFDDTGERDLELTIHYRFVGNLPENAERAAMPDDSFKKTA